MDPLSITASVIAILQLTGKVIEYLNDVKDAPKDCQRCVIEISNLQNLLLNLRFHLQDANVSDPWFVEVQLLNVGGGPLDQYKQALEQLRSMVEIQNGALRIKQQLLWKYSKAEVTNLLARMERLKSLISIALEMDHFKLSRAIKDCMNALSTDSQIIKDHTKYIRDAIPGLQALGNAKDIEQHEKIMQWLSSSDFPAQWHDIISRKQENTGQWFIDSPEFTDLLHGASKTLFCPGIPGAGKTMMASIAIDSINSVVKNNDIGIAYVFCNYKDQIDQYATNLLAALLKQLVHTQPSIAAPVTQLYADHSCKNTKPSFTDIFKALNSICSNYVTVHIVVDALDECTDKDGIRTHFINTLRKLQLNQDVRLMFTSRFIPEITQDFVMESTLEIRASKEDIERYIHGRMLTLPKCIQRDPDLKCAITSKIIETVDGMFLLAQLHVDSLRDKKNKHKVLSTLDNLSKGSTALDKAYSEALERIDGQMDGDCSLARSTLSWITYAQRHLTIKELCHALAIEPGDKSLNGDNIYDVEDVISVCAGLVTVDEESNIVRFVHYTTQEYFERVCLDWNPDAHKQIAEACITYLCFDTFSSGGCDDYGDFEQRLAENALIDYMAHYWGEHIRPVEETISRLTLRFLCDETLIDSIIQVVSVEYWVVGSIVFVKQASGLHLTALYGLLCLTKRLLKEQFRDSNTPVDSQDSYGRTPLSWAAEGGHEAVVKLLVEREDVDADSKDSYGQTPLNWAAKGGHEAVVKLLVEREDVAADSKDYDGQTPLSWAARAGHEAVVKLLVEREDVAADSKDQYGRTPLSYAARGGHEAVVKLLVEREDVAADSKDSYGQTPLNWAARYGHEAVVKLLVEREDVAADSKDSNGRTPLIRAAWGGYEAVVKLLVEREDVAADSKDSNGRTPLTTAAWGGYEAVVKLLVEREDVAADSKDSNGRTPLSRAARYGNEAVVKLLVEREDVDADSKDDSGRTPLNWAARYGHEAVVKLLTLPNRETD